MDREVVQGVGQTNRTDTYQRGEQKKNEEKSYEKKTRRKTEQASKNGRRRELERMNMNAERFKRRS